MPLLPLWRVDNHQQETIERKQQRKGLKWPTPPLLDGNEDNDHKDGKWENKSFMRYIIRQLFYRSRWNVEAVISVDV